MKFNLTVILNVDTDITPEELKQVEYLLEMEDKEATPENIKNYLESILKYYLSNDLSSIITNNNSNCNFNDVLKAAISTEYNSNPIAYAEEGKLIYPNGKTESVSGAE